jgi:predicted alpha/beta superfamily hydrolase
MHLHRLTLLGAILLASPGALSAHAMGTVADRDRLIPLSAVHSRVLGQTRRVLVYLPKGYRESPRARYPVLYLQDGQNCFDARTSFIGVEWGLDEIVDRLTAEGKLPPLLMVAVYNERTRMEDYAPGEGACRYLRFLTDELKPLVDRRFRTRIGPRDTAIMGSSLGGLFATFATLERPDVFGQSASLSAVFSFRGEELVRMLARGPKRPVRMYLDFGDRELAERGPALAEEFRRQVPLFTRAGYVEGRDVVLKVISGGEHNERAWAARVADPLSFLWSTHARRQ